MSNRRERIKGNDTVYDYEFNTLFTGKPEEVKHWLETHDISESVRVGVSAVEDVVMPAQRYLTAFYGINR